MIFLHWFETHVAQVVAILGYLVTFSLIPVVLARKRRSTVALSWCLVIILLPFVGMILFLVFGASRVNRRVRKKRFHRLRFVRQWVHTISDEPHHEQLTSKLEESHEWEGMDRLANRMGAVKVSHQNKVQIYEDSTEAFEAKLLAIESAKKHVHLEYYIYRDDATGQRLLDLLCRKADEGVEVRLLLDSVGSPSAKKIIAKLNAAGGKGVRFFPIIPWRRRLQINFRNHRKILVCDGKTAFVGGANIGDEYLGKSPRFGYWRDTEMRVVGPAVLGLQRVFVEDWDFASDELLSGAKYFPKPSTDGTDKLQIIWSGPDQEHNALRQVYFSSVVRATSKLLIATPYFVPHEELLTGLKNAALRGVDVQIMTQSYPADHMLAYFAGSYYWDELLEFGIRVFQYEKGTFHAKIMLVDDCWGSVGSANFDIRSLTQNFEVSCLIYNQELIDQLSQQFRDDLAQCRELTPVDILNRSYRSRLMANFCRLFSPIL